MARTIYTPQEIVGPYPSNFLMSTLTWALADISNQNRFLLTGREIILARNDDVGTKNVTLTSIAGGTNKRVGNVTKAMGAGTYAAFSAAEMDGWIQSDGYFYLEADDADIFFAIIRY